MKNKQPKVTNKEIQFHISKLYNQNGQMGQVIDGIGNMFYNYLDYKKDKNGFAQFCKDQEPKEKDGQSK
jgi:hypothetical protein